MRELTVITDNGDVEIAAAKWQRQSDGSRVFFNDDGDKVAEFDRENFVAVKETDDGGSE